jgi:hypothetical protein
MSALKTYLKLQKGYSKEGEKLTRKEVVEVQDIVANLQAKGKSATSIIKYLQGWNGKLSEYWKAKRAFDTEQKRIDSQETIEAAGDLDISTFKAVLSPHACPICRRKTDNGTKIFDTKELTKSGYGHIPPFHPNCYCTLVAE